MSENKINVRDRIVYTAPTIQFKGRKGIVMSIQEFPGSKTMACVRFDGRGIITMTAVDNLKKEGK